MILIFGIFFVTLLLETPSKTAKTVNSINKKPVNSESINYNDLNKNTVGDSYVKNQDSQKMPDPKAGPAPVIEKDEIMVKMISELKINNFYGGQTEGQFYEKHIFYTSQISP